MPQATLTSKGQVTVPREVRELLHLKAGDKIDFTIISDDEILLMPVTRRVDEVFGCLHAIAGGKGASVEDMDAGIRRQLQREIP